jgi:hypothetical protein
MSELRAARSQMAMSLAFHTNPPGAEPEITLRLTLGARWGSWCSRRLCSI